jgi:hypothetical protein
MYYLKDPIFNNTITRCEKLESDLYKKNNKKFKNSQYRLLQEA